MKIINLKLNTLSILFLIGFVLIIFFSYLNPFSNNKDKPSINYIIEQGETCSEIAHKFGVSVVSIVELNNLKSDCSDIYHKQILIIPYPVLTVTPLGFVSPMPYVDVDCDAILYIVKEGDTIESISQNWAIPAESIKNYNGIVHEKNALLPGNELRIPLCFRKSNVIPSSTPEPIYDVFPVRCEVVLEVLESDTLDAIAANYMVSKEDIIKYNRLKSDEISPNMKLIIPMCGNMPTPTVTPIK